MNTDVNELIAVAGQGQSLAGEPYSNLNGADPKAAYSEEREEIRLAPARENRRLQASAVKEEIDAGRRYGPHGHPIAHAALECHTYVVSDAKGSPHPACQDQHDAPPLRFGPVRRSYEDEKVSK